MNDDALVNKRRYFAHRVYREIFRLLMLARGQIQPRGVPLEPFFQKGYARFARIGSRLVIEHFQHSGYPPSANLVSATMNGQAPRTSRTLRQPGEPKSQAEPNGSRSASGADEESTR